jgi:hypothetical protein
MNRGFFLKSAVVALLVLVILSFYVPFGFADSFVFAPKWLKKGVYAEYTFTGGLLRFPGVTGDIDRIYFVDGTFRWECVDLNETMATLNLTFSHTQTEMNGKPFVENKTVLLVEEVYVDKVSRALYLRNGTLIGTTTFWLPANPSAGEEIVLWDVPPDKVSLTVSNLSQIQTRVLTPQGGQPAFKIEKQGKINGKPVFFRGSYDFDTGIVNQSGLEYEPFMSALGIISFIIDGMMILSDTNIDLGPAINSFDFRTILTVIALAVSFVIIFVAVYRRRTKRRH